MTKYTTRRSEAAKRAMAEQAGLSLLEREIYMMLAWSRKAVGLDPVQVARLLDLFPTVTLQPNRGTADLRFALLVSEWTEQTRIHRTAWTNEDTLGVGVVFWRTKYGWMVATAGGGGGKT